MSESEEASRRRWNSYRSAMILSKQTCTHEIMCVHSTTSEYDSIISNSIHKFNYCDILCVLPSNITQLFQILNSDSGCFEFWSTFDILNPIFLGWRRHIFLCGGGPRLGSTFEILNPIFFFRDNGNPVAVSVPCGCLSRLGHGLGLVQLTTTI